MKKTAATGWLNLLGWVGATASVDFACASLIQSQILISTRDADGGGYLLTNAQLLGIIAGMRSSAPCLLQKSSRSYLSCICCSWK